MIIDYEKLKEAHRLAEDFYDKTGRSVIVESSISFGCRDYGHFLYLDDELNPADDFTDIDDLIARLNELLEDRPKDKFEVGQKVYGLYAGGDCVGEFTIIRCPEVKGDCYMTHDGFANSLWDEDKLYNSREELIESRINYWKGLLNE